MLKAVCEEDRIFLPTFPLAQMSSKELEVAASGPARFASSMMCYGRPRAEGSENAAAHEVHIMATNVPQYKRTCHLDSSSTASLDWKSNHSLFLVPGGRFLILQMTKGVQLWDLGVPWAPSSREYPCELSQYRTTDAYWDSTVTLVHPSGQSGESLRIVRQNVET